MPRLELELQCIRRQTFKSCSCPKAGDQSMAQHPRGCSLNAVFAANDLGFRYALISASVSERSMQSCQVNTRLACVPVYDHQILKVLTFYKVCFKEALV